MELDLTANLRIGLNDYQVEQQAVDQLIEATGADRQASALDDGLYQVEYG